MTKTTRLIAVCAALAISVASFAAPASAKSMVKRNRPHGHHMMYRHHMMHHHMMRHHMYHRHMMMHRHGM